MSVRVLAGGISAAGGTNPVLMTDGFNVTVSGTFVATVQMERSFDSGVTWVPVAYADGSTIQWTGPLSTVFDEPESGVLYRLNCTAYTSGTANWRISQ